MVIVHVSVVVVGVDVYPPTMHPVIMLTVHPVVVVVHKPVVLSRLRSPLVNARIVLPYMVVIWVVLAILTIRMPTMVLMTFNQKD